MSADNAGLSIGELMGAAMFVTFVVVGIIAIVAPFTLPRRPFIRDSVAFIGALILVLIICSDSQITNGEGWLLMAYYFAYVAVVVVGALIYQRQKARLIARTVLAATDENDATENGDTVSITSSAGPLVLETDGLLVRSTSEDGDRRNRAIYDDEGFDSDFFHPQFKPPSMSSQFLRLPGGGTYSRSLTLPSSNFGDRDHPRILLRRNTDAGSLGPTRILQPNPVPSVLVSIGSSDDDNAESIVNPTVFAPATETEPPQGPAISRRLMAHMIPLTARWPLLSPLERLHLAIQIPVVLVFALTIPAVLPDEMDLYERREKLRMQRADSVDDISYAADDDDVGSGLELDEDVGRRDLDRDLTVLQLALAPAFVAGALDKLNSPVLGTSVPMWVFCTFLGAAGGAIMYAATRTHSVLRYGRFLAVYGFVISVIWVYVIASEAVVMLTAIASVLGMSETIMGLTLFALGNSVGDLMTNVNMAVMGYPTMAVGACFGSPMLNLVLGIGVTSTYLTGTRGQPYQIAQSLTPVYACGVALIVGLVGAVCWLPLNGFKATRKFGIASLLCYVVFMAAILVLPRFVA
ncbi:hypothetical protein HKX48_006709 [Thoreauomyces humboldtii]|nr:hypothetical protein HKX48_006709 [Thoreauomyces humboldtii]